MSISDIIGLVLRNKAIAWLLVLVAVVGSLWAIRSAPLDAIPDISEPQIIVYAKWPRSPQLLEDRVTQPLIQSLVGSVGVKSIRGTSHMGYAFIYVILDGSVEREVVQQRVVDRVSTVRAQLPADASITLGPNASSMGWIYQYAVVSTDGSHDLRELRLLNESTIKLALQSVSGVAEVASVGGLEKQYQIKLFPPLLGRAGLTLEQVAMAVQGALQEVGGRTIDVTSRDYQLRGTINASDIDKLEFTVVGRDGAGQAVRLKDIGYIQIGYDLRRSITDLDGTGEVVGGIVVMEHNQNVLGVTRSVEAALEQLKATLPVGIEVVPTYNRSTLIWETIRGFVETLGYELLVVVAVVVVFLRRLKTAIAPVTILLLATLFTALPLLAFNQTINLLSLAGLAIAIGEMIDATIVIVENCTAELAARGPLEPAQRREVIVRSIATVTRPLLFSLLIILASFLPIFFLGDREARLFDPLAFTKTAAMAFSTLLTVFLLPVMILWIFRGMVGHAEVHTEGWFVRAYRAVLAAVIRYRYVFTGCSLVLLGIAVFVGSGFRRDYMPEMEEGSVLYMPTTLPGLPAREAGWILQQMDRKLKAFPEVERVFGKLGRADTATDPAPVSMIETTILLKPHAQWRPGMTKQKLVAEMDQSLQIIGYVNSWTQPISTRVLMQDTGIQTSVGIKVKGRDTAVIEGLGRKIEELLRDFPGTASVIAERISDGYFIDAQHDLVRMAERNVTADEALDTIRYGLGGDNIATIPEDDGSRVPMSMQYSSEYIDTMAKIRDAPVVAQDGRLVPLQAVADVSVRKLPEMLRNDNGMLAGYVYVYINNTTAPDYVEAAQSYLQQNLELPAGYQVEWTGLYQYAKEARARLWFVVPATLAIIFALLLLAFRSWADSALIMLSVPFAMIGGVFLQWVLGYPMTTAVIIGYVALFAVAIQTGIIMIVFIRQALARRREDESYVDAIIEGSVARLRPKLMTVVATVLSLLPVMFSNSQGMEITKPIATPTVGGMASSTIYVLLLIPCLFAISHDIRGLLRKRSAG